MAINHTSNQAGPALIFKVVLLGDAGVGKTSLVNAFMNEPFTNDYHATIGIDFIGRTMRLDDGRFVRLRVWDTAGQERFRSLIPSYLRDAHVVILVYDVSSTASRRSLERWTHEILKFRRLGSALSLYVVANKCDLSDERRVIVETQESIERDISLWCREGVAPPFTTVCYAETSARNVVSVHALFDGVTRVLAAQCPEAATMMRVVHVQHSLDIIAPDMHIATHTQDAMHTQAHNALSSVLNSVLRRECPC